LVKEVFGPTVQGEGMHAGAPCVFLRFAGCNLECTWCDTDYSPSGAERLDAATIVRRVRGIDRHGSRRVVVTGGEPTLQWDAPLAAALREAGFVVHMESNGTRALRAPVDWLTVSPKPQFHLRGESLVVSRADECKVVVDEALTGLGAMLPARMEALDAQCAKWGCSARFLQPCMDGRYDHHLAATIDLVTRYPHWRLSLQLHKLLGVP
jgi:organic radical activating enzyme